MSFGILNFYEIGRFNGQIEEGLVYLSKIEKDLGTAEGNNRKCHQEREDWGEEIFGVVPIKRLI